MSDEANDPLEEAQRIFEQTNEQVMIEDALKQIMQQAIPMVTLFKYLTVNGVSEKTAEKMLVIVWRKWHERNIEPVWWDGPEEPGED